MSENSNHVRRTLAAVVRGALAPMQLVRIGSALLIAATCGHASQDATSSASYALPNELVLRIVVTHRVVHEGDSLTIVATLANVGDSTRRHRSATTCHLHILLTTESGSPLPAAWHTCGDAITGLILPPGDSTVVRLSLRAGRQSDFMAHRIGPGRYLAYASVDDISGRAGLVRVTVLAGVPPKRGVVDASGPSWIIAHFLNCTAIYGSDVVCNLEGVDVSRSPFSNGKRHVFPYSIWIINDLDGKYA